MHVAFEKMPDDAFNALYEFRVDGLPRMVQDHDGRLRLLANWMLERQCEVPTDAGEHQFYYAQLFIAEYRRAGESGFNTGTLINRISLFMRQNLHAGLSIAMLCRHFNLSRSTLYRAFKEHYDLSPQRYLRQIRYERAVNLRQHHNLSFGKIAQEIGLSSPQSVRRLFEEYAVKKS